MSVKGGALMTTPMIMMMLLTLWKCLSFCWVYIATKLMPRSVESGEVCAECPCKGQGGLVLRGFSFEVFNADPLNSECYCHVDKANVDSSFEDTDTGNDVCNALFWDGNAPVPVSVSVGTGEIAIVDFHYNIRIWSAGKFLRRVRRVQRLSRQSQRPSRQRALCCCGHWACGMWGRRLKKSKTKMPDFLFLKGCCRTHASLSLSLAHSVLRALSLKAAEALSAIIIY